MTELENSYAMDLSILLDVYGNIRNRNPLQSTIYRLALRCQEAENMLAEINDITDATE